MVISGNELLQLVKNNTASHLTLFYAAEQLPKGRMLTSLHLGKSEVTFNHLRVKAGSAGAIALAEAFRLWWFFV